MADQIIAVGGENLIDQVTTEENTVNYPGGSPFNVAVAAARQEASVRYVSPVSTDQWGDMLAARLREAGATLAGGRNDLPTTMAKVTINAGIPTYRFEREGTAERAVDEGFLMSALGEDVAALHTGSLTLIEGPDAAAWEAVLAAGHARGTVISLDPNVRLSIISDVNTYRARILRIIKHVHILKLSDEDLEGLYPDLDQEAAIRRLRESTSASFIVLTRGAAGAVAWVGREHVDVPVVSADPLVDTVGAGDTFMATVLATLASKGYLTPDGLAALTQQDAADILNRAALAAALNCEREGCDPPSKDELEAAFAELT